MGNFSTMILAFNCPCALQPFSGGAILFCMENSVADYNTSNKSGISFCTQSADRPLLILIKLTYCVGSNPAKKIESLAASKMSNGFYKM